MLDIPCWILDIQKMLRGARISAIVEGMDFLTRGVRFLGRMSLPVWAGVSLCLATAVFVFGFSEVWRRHRRYVEDDVARQVYTRGGELTEFFAGTLEARRDTWSGAAWERFGLLVESLHAGENRLQYVGITQGDETLFLRQTPGNVEAVSRPVRTVERLLEAGGDVVPIMVFEREIPQPDAPPWVVSLALRREILSDAGRIPADLLSSLYWFVLLVGAVSLGVSAGLLVWAIRRDREHESRRRREEHLMFSGVLASGIAHDFRNPMSSARLDAQMLCREAEREGGARVERMGQLANRISGTVARMDRVFQEFLSLGKPGEGNVEALELLPCLHECVEILAARAEQNGVSVRVEGGGEGLRVLAEPFALRRACVNILANAIDFSNEITLRVSRDKHHASVDFCDNGPGIPESDREKVFEMFHTTRAEGTGLGLFLARTAVEKCGGSVTALPSDSGARIRVTLIAP